MERRPTDNATTELTINWPSRSEQRRHPLWVSPSAASVVVQIDRDPKEQTIVNAPNVTGGSVRITIDAPTGRHTFTFVVYDRRQKTGEAAPIGNVVGRAAVEKDIVRGKKTTIAAKIGGVVGRVEIAAAPGQPFLVADPTNGFDFVGGNNNRFILTAEDADGYVIIPQPERLALAPSLSSMTYLRVTRPNRTKEPEMFEVGEKQPLPLGKVAGILASATDTFGDVARASAQLRELSGIYVAYSDHPGASSPIVLYDALSRATVALPSTSFAGLGSVAALAYDSIDHRLLVGDTTNGIVEAFDGLGNSVSGYTPIHVADIKAIAYNPVDQEIYVTGASGITTYTSSGTVLPLGPTSFNRTSAPGPMAFVQTNQIAVGESSFGSIDAYNQSGAYLKTSPLLSTAILGLATSYASGSPTSAATDVFAIATPLMTGDANLFDVTPGNSVKGLAIVVDPRAVAQDPLSNTLYVASGSANEIIPLAYLTWKPGPPIQAPDGYSVPVAMAITY
jgi:hypothetical protein